MKVLRLITPFQTFGYHQAKPRWLRPNATRIRQRELFGAVQKQAEILSSFRISLHHGQLPPDKRTQCLRWLNEPSRSPTTTDPHHLR